MGDIQKYKLEDKSTKPPFEYILLTGSSYVDYYLFKENELEEAMEQLKREYIKGYHIAKIYVPHFCNSDRTWRVEEFMRLDIHGKARYEKCGKTSLHIKFYLDAGEWLNPRILDKNCL